MRRCVWKVLMILICLWIKHQFTMMTMNVNECQLSPLYKSYSPFVKSWLRAMERTRLKTMSIWEVVLDISPSILSAEPGPAARNIVRVDFTPQSTFRFSMISSQKLYLKKTRLLYCNTFCFCPRPVHHQIDRILLKLYESLFNVQMSFVKLFVLFVTFHWIILYWWWLFINRRYVWVYYLLVQCFC